MPKVATSKTTHVVGGAILREAQNGRLVSVKTGKSSAKASPKSDLALAQASSKRAEALKRLASR